MNETQFQKAVIDAARLYGWRVAHFRPARTKNGEWRTPVAADAKGWSDLCLVHDRIVWLELKDARRKVTAEQAEWIAALNAAGGTALVVRPSDLDAVIDALKRPAGKAA